ncbi:Cupin 2 conserved barrel domain protein [Desulfatibacillum aliphaticivorans]|uniref:Cupin 2 conserved barrel domain protein n=1 Tax=Desulfatibacillum aliphaticivorans TaxID=218208 RepID=B8FMX1_DESAL|nr:cupin domain-containing protein [Desulfatibacillum aliphaticivorans]ACL05841.1 Cupin 2 conserved barrel domain protein [Desulfatibacillum aliphaticivorans]
MKHIHCPDVDAYDAGDLGLEGTNKMNIRVISENTVWMELGIGGYTPDHVHDDKERLVMLSGKAVIKLGDKKIEVGPGDFAEIDNEPHQVINIGDEPFIFMGFRNQT